MDNNEQRPIEINLKDLLFVILRKTGIILFAGIVFAGAIFGYKTFRVSNDVDILDTSIQYDGESDADYQERVLKVNRAQDLIQSNDVLNNQIENQRQYVTNSILMQINTENEAVTTANLVVTIDGNQATGVDMALVSSYAQDISSGVYLSGLAEEMDTNQGYLAELIEVNYKTSSSVVVDSADASGSAGTIAIEVVGPTTELTNKIMDLILEQVEVKHAELDETMISHIVTLVGRQNSYIVDNDTRDSQYNAANRFESLQKQISTNEEALDTIASELNLSGADSLYEYFSFNDGSESSLSVKTAFKYAAFGFVAVVAIGIFVVVIKYVFGRKFSTQAKFFGRFIGLSKIGVTKPLGRRSRFEQFIDLKTDDDSTLSEDDNNKLIAANLSNLTLGMEKILVTGTADADKIKDLIKKLGVKADVKESFFADPKVLESVSGYDGVILVEQRNYSDCKLITKEIMLISNTNAKLIGAIVI